MNSQRMRTALVQRIEFEVKPSTITNLGQLDLSVKAVRQGQTMVDRTTTLKTSSGLTDKQIREELLRGQMADYTIGRGVAASEPAAVN